MARGKGSATTAPFFIYSEVIMWERIGSVLSVLAAFAGAWIYVDSHYASATDVGRLAKDFRLQTYDLRKRQLNDRIFEFEFKQNSRKLSDLETAQLSAAKRELQEIVSQEALVKQDK